ncbi:MAG: hypothetical protein PHV60_00365 [bacterium]|nr:hypothetical protein [bacterium]
MLSTLIHKYNWGFIKPLLIETYLYLLVGLVVIALLLYLAKKTLKVKIKWSLALMVMLLLLQYFWYKHCSIMDILAGKFPMSTQVGVIDQGTHQIKGSGQSGFLAYGPYMPLAQGAYKVTFRIKLDNLNNQDAGFCDVNVVEHPESYVRTELVLEGFKKQNPQNVSLVFNIPAGNPRTEFRVFQYSGNNLTVVSLHLMPAGIREIVLQNKDNFFKTTIYILGALIFIGIFLKWLLAIKDRPVKKALGMSSLVALISGLMMAMIWHWKGFSHYTFVEYYDMWRVFYAPAWLPLIFVFFDFLCLINEQLGFNKEIEKYLKYDRYTLLILPAFIITELLVKNINSHILLGNFYLGTLTIKSIVYFIFLWKNLKHQQDIESNKAVKWTIFLSIFTVYLLITPWVNAAFYTDGDETRHLIKAQSIVRDNDLNVTNNVDNIDNLAYHPDVRWTLWWGQSTNSGYSILLTPGFMLGGRFGATLIMNLFGAFLTLNLFMLIYYFSKSVVFCFLGAIMISFTCPLGIYSFLLYPEIIAAAGGLYLLRKLIELKDHREIINILTIISVAVFLIFLKERYVTITAVILIALIYKIRKKIKYILIALGLVTIAVGLFIAFDKITYNLNQTHRIVGSFFGIPARFSNIYRGSAGLMGLFLDQEAGLLVYNPLYLLALLGLIGGLISNENRRRSYLLLALFLPYFLIISFNGEWEITGALAPRYIIAVIPVLAVALGLFLYQCRRLWLKIITFTAAFWAFGFYYILLLVPQYRVHSPNAITGRNEVLDRLYASGVLPDLASILPSILKPSDITYFMVIIYFLLFLTLVILFLKQYATNHEEISRANIRKHKYVLLFFILLSAGVFMLLYFNNSNRQEFEAVNCYVGGGYRSLDQKANEVVLNGQGFFVLTKIAARKNEELEINVVAKGDDKQHWPIMAIYSENDKKKVKISKIVINNDTWQEYTFKYVIPESGLLPFWFEHDNFAGSNKLYLKKMYFEAVLK